MPTKVSVFAACPLLTGHAYRRPLLTARSPLQVMYTKDTEFEAFWRKLQATWDKLWADVYAADASGAPGLFILYPYPILILTSHPAAYSHFHLSGLLLCSVLTSLFCPNSSLLAVSWRCLHG